MTLIWWLFRNVNNFLINAYLIWSNRIVLNRYFISYEEAMFQNIIEIIILSAIQGISEFLPISSSVHGYAGFIGLVICGFVLNGYPSSGYSVGAMFDGSTYATINPLGQFIGAIIMFVVLGLIPGYIIAKVLNGMGKLRIPREVEIAGLDYEMMETAKDDEKAVASATR